MVQSVFTIPLGRAASANSESLSARWLLDAYYGDAANSVAAKAAEWLCHGRRRFSPWVFFGPRGVGKSLFLQAVADRWKLLRPESAARVLTGADFVRRWGQAVDTGTMPTFRSAVRNVQLLVVDGLPSLVTRRGALEEFVQTLDAFAQDDRQVVVSSDIPPAEWGAVPPALRSRLVAGVAIRMEAPGTAARAAILTGLVQKLNLVLLPEESRTLLELANTTSFASRTVPEWYANLRCLEGALAHSARPLDSAILSRSLTAAAPAAVPTLKQVAGAAARYYGVTLAELRGPSRRRRLVEARGMAVFLARCVLGLSFQRIGHYFDRDHTTILHAFRAWDRNLRLDPVLRAVADDLAHTLGGYRVASLPNVRRQAGDRDSET